MKELQKMMGRWGVCSYVSRAEALTDRDSKFVKTRWVLTEKGIDVRSRFVVSVCQGDPREDLMVGTPPLFAARLHSKLSRPAFDAYGLGHLMCLSVGASGKGVLH